METTIPHVLGYMYPNELELQRSILIVLYPVITGLVAGAFILASLEKVLNVEAVRPTYRLALLTARRSCWWRRCRSSFTSATPSARSRCILTPNLNSAMAMFGFALEEKFVAEGFGTERIDLMYNDFVIVGPANDPAGIKGMKLAADALKRISEKGALFINLGDNSGTHVAEMELWKAAGIKPSGSWYQVFEKGSTGNVPTLQYTDQKAAYTVIDRATFLTLQKQIKLVVLVEKDEALLNFISLIPVNPQKFPKVYYHDAMVFVKWLTSPDKGQKIIRDFGKDKYGSPLFFPNSKEWRQAQGGKS